MRRPDPMRPIRRLAADPSHRTGTRAIALLVVALLGPLACTAPAPRGYRFSAAGSHWSGGEAGDVDDLMGRYPFYFAVILDPASTRNPDLRPLRHDIERDPVDHFNFDALNAIAVGYFELSYRAGLEGATYFADEVRAAKLLAVPRKAYGSTADPELRDAILDFFADAASGQKIGTTASAPQLARIVASLETRETDPVRHARIVALLQSLGVEPPAD